MVFAHTLLVSVPVRGRKNNLKSIRGRARRRRITSVIDSAVQFHYNRTTVNLLYELRQRFFAAHFEHGPERVETKREHRADSAERTCRRYVLHV